MFVIKREQMDALARAMRARFKRNVSKVLEKAFPEKVLMLGEKSFSDTVDRGVTSAEKYGLHQEREIELYLHLMFALSFDFDTNPATAWSREVLGATRLQPETRVRLLSLIYKQVRPHHGK